MRIGSAIVPITSFPECFDIRPQLQSMGAQIRHRLTSLMAGTSAHLPMSIPMDATSPNDGITITLLNQLGIVPRHVFQLVDPASKKTIIPCGRIPGMVLQPTDQGSVMVCLRIPDDHDTGHNLLAELISHFKGQDRPIILTKLENRTLPRGTVVAGGLKMRWVHNDQISTLFPKATRSEETVFVNINTMLNGANQVHYDAKLISEMPPVPSLVYGTKIDEEELSAVSWKENFGDIMAIETADAPTFAQLMALFKSKLSLAPWQTDWQPTQMKMTS